ncbi:MAG: hypothetical protein OEN52_07335 [Gammaproteobacteria bacterium]|nr:hypothetical protein [Gammaproteobacteria bacterium]MDH3560750.1 hypothetical protein [Gammaproteobacteria bacterium]
MARSIIIILLALGTFTAQAGNWSSRLLNGNEVVVDPGTNRATVTVDGITTQLWQGTHRLQDGSILIIRNGVAVPNEKILESRELPVPEPSEWEDAPIIGYSPCEKLVRKVCGKEGQCVDAKSCNPSQQLLSMEREEREASDNHNLMTYTSGQCLKADRDKDFFVSCNK